jgi:hypothetical protein
VFQVGGGHSSAAAAAAAGPLIESAAAGLKSCRGARRPCAAVKFNSLALILRTGRDAHQTRPGGNQRRAEESNLRVDEWKEKTKLKLIELCLVLAGVVHSRAPARAAAARLEPREDGPTRRRRRARRTPAHFLPAPMH